MIGQRINGHVAQPCNPVNMVGETVTMMVNALAALYVEQTTVGEFFHHQQTVVLILLHFLIVVKNSEYHLKESYLCHNQAFCRSLFSSPTFFLKAEFVYIDWPDNM